MYKRNLMQYIWIWNLKLGTVSAKTNYKNYSSVIESACFIITGIYLLTGHLSLHTPEKHL